MATSEGSQDSYEARRAQRAARAGVEDDDAMEAVDGVGPAATSAAQAEPAVALRPGEVLDEDGNASAKTKKPRPKLSYGDLTSQAGIPHVFGTFREAFHQQHRGKGHEAADLGRLLDMYERWQIRLFPHCDFDTFLSRVANLHGKPGGKATKGATLKCDMRELRESVIQLALEHIPIADENAAPNEAAAPPGDGRDDGDDAAGVPWLAHDSGDGMSQQLIERPASSQPRAAAPTAGVRGRDSIFEPRRAAALSGDGAADSAGAAQEEDEELLDLMDADPVAGGLQAGGGASEVEDDELDDMMI